MKMHVFMLHFGLGKRQTENLGRFEVENLEIFFENHSPKKLRIKKARQNGLYSVFIWSMLLTLD